jgi:competence protein ComEC
MTPSKIFLYFCLSFLGGIFLSSFFAPPPFFILGAGLILAILLISVFWQYKKLVIVGFCILFLVVGIWRHQEAELRTMNNELRNFNDSGKEITLIGIVFTEPDIKEDKLKLIIRPEKIDGKILVTTNRYPEYQYGDKLKITGKLVTPPVFERFNYRDYLKKEGIYSMMNFPKIEVLNQNLGNPVYKLLFSFKNKFQETARNFISPPQEGILEALIFGEEGNISKEWKAKLNFTGTRHITAVSGMNITIIASLLLAFALSCGLWRQQAFYLSIFLLFLYILMIGAPPSAVRAGIMGGLFLTAQYFGRLSAASRTIVFAATFMLALNPLLLRLDLGFQLSFLAMMGMIYLQLIFLNFFKRIPNFKFFPLKTTLSTTLSAQVFTLPILIYNFGYIPLISPLINILIVPFLAPITILIFIFGILGMIFWGFGLILSWPTWFCLSYITEIIDFFSKISFASLRLENVPWIFLLISYLLLAIITWRLQESQKLKFLNY